MLAQDEVLGTNPITPASPGGATEPTGIFSTERSEASAQQIAIAAAAFLPPGAVILRAAKDLHML